MLEMELNFRMEKKIILHLCADTGSDSKPYKDAGYEVILVGSKIGVENYTPPKNVHGIIANPVCIEFSRARSFGKPRNPEEGMKLVNECLRIIREANPKWWVIENPATGALRDYLGKPIYTYQPYEFGSPWTKRTGLWGKFNSPKKLYTKWSEVPKNNKLYIRPGRSKPSMANFHKSAIKDIPEFSEFKVDSDMEFRSLCSQGFAKAFLKANP